MRKIFLSATFLLAITVTQAQVRRAGRPAMAKDSTGAVTGMRGGADRQDRKEMMRELGLSKEQKLKFRDMQRDNKAKREAIENDEKLSDTERKEKLRALKLEQMKATDNILNDEQKEKMKKMRREKMKERKDGKEPAMEEEIQ